MDAAGALIRTAYIRRHRCTRIGGDNAGSCDERENPPSGGCVDERLRSVHGYLVFTACAVWLHAPDKAARMTDCDSGGPAIVELIAR